MPINKTFESVEAGNIRRYDWSSRINEDDFRRKVESTKDFIKQCIDSSARPVITCSFGKDSLVMLHLVHSIKKVPVIYWREPFFQSKFEFPQKIAQKMNLEVYDYPPFYVDHLIDGKYAEVYNFYDVGGIPMVLYTGCCSHEGHSEYLCAVKDLILRPKCTGYEFQWDCVFHGHKQSDPLYICDNKPLPKVQTIPSGLLTLPIIDWTDDEIWAYIDLFKVEYNDARYDRIDQNSNNDMYPTCFECLKNKDGLFCSKLGRDVKFCGKTEEQHNEFKQFLAKSAYNNQGK